MRGRHGARHGRSWFGFGQEHDQGGPWGFRGKFFESGEVRIALLSLLTDGPKHGYELMKEMEARSGGMYKASAGTVYPNLQMMEDEGLVRVEVRDDGKRVFTITDDGRKELDQQKETIDRIWSRASNWGDWSDAMSAGGMEVWGPALRLARVAFKAAAGGDEAKIEKVRKVLSNAAADLENL